MPTSLIAPLVASGISYGASKLLGPKGSATAPLTGFAPPGFSAGGLNGTYSNGGYSVTPTAGRSDAVNNVAGSFTDLADTLAGLRGTVAPGVSAYRAAQLGQVEDARTSAMGNLRDNLARRRVLGSSFAQDAASRGEAEFAKQKAAVKADSFLKELEASHQLIQEEFTARRSSYQTGLDEMNLEANLAASLSGKATDVLGKNAQIEAQLNALSQQNAGKLIGQLTQPVASAAGNAAGKYFTGIGGAAFG